MLRSKIQVSWKSPLLCILLLCAVPMLAQSTADVVMYASKASVKAGKWSVVSDSTAAGGFRISNADAGAAKLSSALASPTNYFELTFNAYAGQAYHLWIRAKAQGNSTNNDSVFVQFSDSVNSSGTATYRIGTTSSAPVVLQDCTGAALSNWGWQDNGWCGMGSNIQFAATGSHKIRVQTREDGLSIDQIVLSPVNYLSKSPGALRNDTKIMAALQPSITSTATASLSISMSPSSGSSPLNVNFTPKVSLSSGSVSSYSWTFGDGTSSTATNPSHTYQSGGNYSVKATVKASTGATATASGTVSVSSTSGGVTVRVLEANIFYGGHGTDNVIDLNRLTNWIVKMNPDIVSLIEVIGGYNDPVNITNLMKQKTGVTWNYYYVPKYSGSPEGVMIMTKWPILSKAQLFLVYQMPIAEATINVNNKHISFFSTHLDWTSSSKRLAQAQQLVPFTTNFAEPRILSGDFNAQTYTSEIAVILNKYDDAWGTAVGAGKATAYADNPVGTQTRTRKSHIDFIFQSKGATNVKVSSGIIPDTRNLSQKPSVLLGTLDDKGVRPSDHNFTSITFTVF